MTEILIAAAIVLVTFAAMEAWAWYAHKYIMHGWGWGWHESHHRPRTGWFEKNDLFAAVFAVPSIALLYAGVHWWWPLAAVGAGMTAYGLMYFIFHDVIVHQRIRWRNIPRFGYLRRIMQAHRMHHARGDKHGCVSFGFLYAPPVRQLKARSGLSR